MLDFTIPGTVTLTFTGSESTAALPALLSGAVRAADGNGNGNVFFPPGYLEPLCTFDVGPVARGAAAGALAHSPKADADNVIVLELSDGGTLVTSAARLHAALRRARPELLDGDTILLEKLRADSASPSRGLGAVVSGVISRVFLLAAGKQPDAIIDTALGGPIKQAELGVSWLGTKLLMRAIEDRLVQKPGLYRWAGTGAGAADLLPLPPAPAKPDKDDAAAGPILIFIHGTASSTLGSFGDLRADPDLWQRLQRQFKGGIFAFEHRTLSDSPIENAIALLQALHALPAGAPVSFATHSRGGLVADLLCLNDFDALIDQYEYTLPRTGAANAAESARVLNELKSAHAEQRTQLRTLAGLLRERKLVIDRYVRVASPANGTLLASANFDVFLSGLLTLLGALPFFIGNPLYDAFKRVVIEIVRNRTDPHLVPGIEAMLPDSPMARLLGEAPVRPGLAMAVIAGDIEGGNMLVRLGVLLTDFLLFDKVDNDLVVNTPSMLAGIAPKAAAHVLFDRGANVSHFHYFSNLGTRVALRDWLTSAARDKLPGFRALPSAADYAAALASAARGRAASTAVDKRPIVVILPGIMGSHLSIKHTDRVWFDPLDIASGGLDKIGWGQRDVVADDLFAMSYGKICQNLEGSHRVECFPYDWRQPLDVLAEKLGVFLEQLMQQTQQSEAPIRLLAHSMGGLVVRACIHQRPALMNTLMQRSGARLVMLGTPNQGAHSMVENLLGKGDALRKLARLDLKHDMQHVLDVVAGFRGALQLLPKPGFTDTFQGQDGGGKRYKYQEADTWTSLQKLVTDAWFGDQRCGIPDQAALDAGAWLWNADGGTEQAPALPDAYAKNSVYVFGVAPNTACGVCEESDGAGAVRLKMVGTTRGDGTVTWASGRIGGISTFYYMPVRHGDLASTPEYFGALTELLSAGSTTLLSENPPLTRAAEADTALRYDAGPPGADDPNALQLGLMGGSLRDIAPPTPRRRLAVRVKAMDLRFLSKPILVGHYEQDAIAGAEAQIDRELLAGDLSMRYGLGQYAGPRGTTTVVLRQPRQFARGRGVLTGAVVTGLGRYDNPLSAADLTESVRTGALRYLLQVVDVLGKDERELPLAALLLGYNSTANLTVAASVEALVCGVMEANARFYEATRLDIRIARLDIVEKYIDTAISAVYALRALPLRLDAVADKLGTALSVTAQLVRGEGMRQRLSAEHGSGFWPRLSVSDADAGERCANADPAAPASAIADRLRFVYVGQRARAEATVKQRQPGLIEALVAQQIHEPAWNQDFGRMLFQLMVPYEFKDAARQLDRLVLVVDEQTANLPWELMIADDLDRHAGSAPLAAGKPLALRTALVRQLTSTRYRPQVRGALANTALVIGNPSVKGFGAAFPAAFPATVAGAPDQELAPLPSAEEEARTTAKALERMGFVVQQAIGAGSTASDVLSKLYQQPWRILHVSAHGVFNLCHADGRRRSGVVLSDGLLITADEINSMEIVPDLVFLNCCHSGQVDTGRGGNKLAASIARELIDIGVRCVIVAGWAVNDDAAKCFANTFYEQLLEQRLPFGDAVFEARKKTWESHKDYLTWGAYQAYGDTGWMAMPCASAQDDAQGSGEYAAPEELLDNLAGTRVDLARQRSGGSGSASASGSDTVSRCAGVEAVLNTRCPAGWRSLPQLQSSLGMTWFELKELQKARAAFLAAIGSQDQQGIVTIRDIERLAHIESLLGEQGAMAELAKTTETQLVLPADEALIDLALQRLDSIDALVNLAASTAPSACAGGGNAVRCELRGDALRCKADLLARQLLRRRLDASNTALACQRMRGVLAQASAAYRLGEGLPGGEQFAPGLALKRLALDALIGLDDMASRDAAAVLARRCGMQAAQPDFSEDSGTLGAVVQAQALLVEQLVQRSLAEVGAGATRLFEHVAAAYAEAARSSALRVSERETMMTELEVMIRLCEALSAGDTGAAALAGTAGLLKDLGQRLASGAAAPPKTLGAGVARLAGSTTAP